ncbi:MAG: hypothetical protein NTV80_19320 [Verrucomicrobia bacterium]|nr:hypothetical protein [Verrucomicrobiota bacterium]
MKTLSKLLMISVLVMPLSIQAFTTGEDNFASATVIPARGDDAFSGLTDLFSMTFETNEATHNPSNPTNHPSLTAGKSAWWKWTPTVSGFCTIDTGATLTYGYNGPGLMQDTVLSVYTGSGVNALTRIVANDLHGNSSLNVDHNLAKVTFYAVAGTTYFIAVDGADPSKVTTQNRYVVLRLLQFEAVAQTRRGLWQIDRTDLKKHGQVTVTTTALGSYSVVLQVGPTFYRFAGQFLANGTSRQAIKRVVAPGAVPLTPIGVYLDARGQGQIGIEIDGAEAFADMPRYLTFPKTAPAGIAGSYNVANNLSFNNLPAARGFLRVSVSVTGAVTAVGFTGDGTPITLSSALCDVFETDEFSAPGFLAVQSGKGSFTFDGYGIQGMTDADDDFRTDTFYHKDAVPSAVYLPSQIDFNEYMTGHLWVKPALNTRPYNFMDPNGAGQLTFFETPGEIASRIYESVTFSTAGKFTFGVSARKPALTFSATTGLVTGSIVTTDTILGITKARTRTIRGIIIKDYYGGAYLFGHATGTTSPVMVQITF